MLNFFETSSTFLAKRFFTLDASRQEYSTNSGLRHSLDGFGEEIGEMLS